MKRAITKVLVTLAAFGLIIAPSNVFAQHNGDKDCKDFASHEEALKYWKDHGYSADNDPERLDKDHDGIPCEELKGGSDKGSNDKGTTDNGGNNNGSTDNGGNDKGTNDNGTNTDKKQGGQLPKTATDMPVNMIAGASALVAGLGLLVLRRRFNT